MSTEQSTSVPSETVTRPGQWSAPDLGPIQRKRLERAIRDIRWLSNTYVELSGVRGNPASESRCRLTELYGASVRNPAALERLAAIGAKFGYLAAKASLPAILQELADAKAELGASLPVHDSRRDPEEVAATAKLVQERERETRERCDAAATAWAAILAKKPAGATALIVAELEKDDSDPMTDYFATSTTRHVAIGWRTGPREDFRQLRRAAEGFEPTAHLGIGKDTWTARVVLETEVPGEHYWKGSPSHWHRELTEGQPYFATEAEAREWVEEKGPPEPIQFQSESEPTRFRWEVSSSSVEHRENYSMGAGNYLKAGSRYGNGWKVRSVGLSGNGYTLFEDALPGRPDDATYTQSPGDAATVGTYRVLDSTNKRGPFYLAVPLERLADADFAAERDRAKAAGGWYSRAWGKTPGGFGFSTRESAESFAKGGAQ